MAHAKAHAKKRALTGAAKTARDFAAGKGYSIRHTEPKPGKHTVVAKIRGKTSTRTGLSKTQADAAVVDAIVKAKG